MVDGLQLDGLASGMPTNDLINQIITAKYEPKLENLSSEKSDLRAEKDTWRDINSRTDSLEQKLTDLKLPSTFNANKTSSTAEDIATAEATSDASEGSYEVDVTQLAKANRVTSQQKSDSFALSLSDDETFTIDLKDADGNSTISNQATITVSDGDTLGDIRDAINNTTVDHDGDSETDEVQIAEASIVDNRLVIESYQPGTDSELSFTDSNSNLLTDDLGFSFDTDGKVTDANNDGTIDEASESGVLQAAQDANFSVNGLDVTRSSNQDIDDVVSEVTFDLKSTGTTTIEVSQDIEKATSAVQDFVDQYNSVRSFISEKLGYDSETEDAGVLQGDGTLMRLQSRLRSLITDSVDSNNDYDQLSAVGIEVEGVSGDNIEATDFSSTSFEFDSGKLEEALKDDPEAVHKLFAADTEDGDSFDGVATRLNNYLEMLTQSNTGVIPEKVDSYENMMEDIDEEVTSVQDQLTMEKERLRSEFTAMETTLSEMNSQMSWMQSQLGSLGSTSNMLSSMM